MPVKTILLHMTDDERNETRLSVAARLARRFSAFVDVVYLPATNTLPTSVNVRGDTYADIVEANVIAQHKAAQAERETHRALKDCTHTWTIAEGDHLDALAVRAITADLAIITVPDPDMTSERGLAHLHEKLPLMAPCPVMILPRDLAVEASVGRHIVIGWRPMRETSLAVRATLPLLASAQKVTLLTLTVEASQPSDTIAEVMLYLERHGINCTQESRALSRGDVGDSLLAAVEELEGDLLIMGAYGHSRLRELVLGGATREVLRDLTVPVIMTH